MVTFPLIVGRHTRRSLPFSPIPCSPNPLFFNSFPLISFADPHHLNPVASYLYKNHRGEGGGGVVCLSCFNSQISNPCICHTSEESTCKPSHCHKSENTLPQVLCLPQIRAPWASSARRNHHAASAACCIIPRRGRPQSSLPGKGATVER